MSFFQKKNAMIKYSTIRENLSHLKTYSQNHHKFAICQPQRNQTFFFKLKSNKNKFQELPKKVMKKNVQRRRQ